MTKEEKLKKYIEYIVSEIGYLSIQKECFFQIKNLIKNDINSNIYLEKYLYENMVYSYIIRLSKILEKQQGRYDDDISLYKIYELLKLSLEQFNAVYSLNSYKKFKEIRNKKICHITNLAGDITWKELDELLNYTQNLVNIALYKITGITIINWKEPLNLISDKNFNMLPFLDISFRDGHWGFYQ